MPELVLIIGPIASGKSTVANALGDRFRAAGRAAAVLDLDDFVDTIGGYAGLTGEHFRQAQVVYGQLVAAWLAESFNVIAHGPFFQTEEQAALVHAVPDYIDPRRVLLIATYEVAMARRYGTQPKALQGPTATPPRLRPRGVARPHPAAQRLDLRYRDYLLGGHRRRACRHDPERAVDQRGTDACCSALALFTMR